MAHGETVVNYKNEHLFLLKPKRGPWLGSISDGIDRFFAFYGKN